MFDLRSRRDTGRKRALFASLLIHVLVLFGWLYRPPRFIAPSSVAWGRPGQSDNLVYFPDKELGTSAARHELHFRPKRKPAKQAAQYRRVPAPSGSPMASSFYGSMQGTEAIPAIPLIFPDPTFHPWELRPGVQGDVVVEVTIDEKGNVTDTRLLESLEQGIDRKVVAAVRAWRFRPATVDGIAVSSRQDVHFHFPS